MSNYFFTSESVSEGHPDKVSDQISDTIVDLMISRFPFARVACETLVTTNKIIVAGEYRLDADMPPFLSNIFLIKVLTPVAVVINSPYGVTIPYLCQVTKENTE